MLGDTNFVSHPWSEKVKTSEIKNSNVAVRESRWLSGRASDSGARDTGFEHRDRREVSLSKTT